MLPTSIPDGLRAPGNVRNDLRCFTRKRICIRPEDNRRNAHLAHVLRKLSVNTPKFTHFVYGGVLEVLTDSQPQTAT